MEGRRRLLIVDDDRAVLRALVRAASIRLGLDVGDVLTATGAREAIGVVRAEEDSGTPVHAVLSDYNMPDGNGFRLYEMIEVRWPQLAKKFVMHTAEPDLGEPRALALRGVPVLSKIETRLVIQAVRSALSP